MRFCFYYNFIAIAAPCASIAVSYDVIESDLLRASISSEYMRCVFDLHLCIPKTYSTRWNFRVNNAIS